MMGIMLFHLIKTICLNCLSLLLITKAYIYDACGKPAPSLFQYTRITRRFGNHTIDNYVDFIKYFRK